MLFTERCTEFSAFFYKSDQNTEQLTEFSSLFYFLMGFADLLTELRRGYQNTL